MLSQHTESTSWGGAPDYLSNSLGTPISTCDLCKQCRSSAGDGVTSLLQKARAMRAWKDSQEGAAGARAAGRAGEGAVTADEVAAAAGVEAGVAVCAPDLHWCCWTQRLPCLSPTASTGVLDVSPNTVATQHACQHLASSSASCIFIMLVMGLLSAQICNGQLARIWSYIHA